MSIAALEMDTNLIKKAETEAVDRDEYLFLCEEELEELIEKRKEKLNEKQNSNQK